VVVTLPPGYDPAVPAPVLVLLHGYGASGALQNLYMGLEPLAGERGMILAVPDGTIDATGKRFWNATDACCDFAGTGVDDSAYLASVLDELAAAYSVDPKRVYFLGHSNGGFMSYRMACDHADRIAAVASLAGAAVASAADCAPSEPVSVLQMHGTVDDVILYEGGVLVSEAYPSAADTVAQWAEYDACAGALEPVGTLDYDSALPGAETTQADYAGCASGAGVSLWTIEGGAHVPTFAQGAMPAALDWLLAHPKP
jgi:polyhydroxybutyrate depolymerase